MRLRLIVQHFLFYGKERSAAKYLSIQHSRMIIPLRKAIFRLFVYAASLILHEQSGLFVYSRSLHIDVLYLLKIAFERDQGLSAVAKNNCILSVRRRGFARLCASRSLRLRWRVARRLRRRHSSRLRDLRGDLGIHHSHGAHDRRRRRAADDALRLLGGGGVRGLIALDINPIWYGVLMTINLELALWLSSTMMGGDPPQRVWIAVR